MVQLDPAAARHHRIAQGVVIVHTTGADGTGMALNYCTATSSVGDKHTAGHDAPKLAIPKGGLVWKLNTG